MVPKARSRISINVLLKLLVQDSNFITVQNFSGPNYHILKSKIKTQLDENNTKYPKIFTLKYTNNTKQPFYIFAKNLFEKNIMVPKRRKHISLLFLY